MGAYRERYEDDVVDDYTLLISDISTPPCLVSSSLFVFSYIELPQIYIYHSES